MPIFFVETVNYYPLLEYSVISVVLFVAVLGVWFLARLRWHKPDELSGVE